MMYHNSFTWNRSDTPAELHTLLETLGEYYPLTESRGGGNLSFRHQNEQGGVHVITANTGAIIEYGTINSAARGIGMAIAGNECNEKHSFKNLGIMLDCSRNAVMKVEHVKKWLTQLSLMGYNMVMLYTEDTYEIPGELYFGYLRGRYSAAELKEIDAFAALLNMEIIGCIQTLGHLNKMLRWPAYDNVRDTAAVMLADNEPTYELVEKMVAQIGRCISSRRIHIGMDETFDLGLGEYLRRNGYVPEHEIYNRHLGRIVEICKKHGLKPMIWSDMYFRDGIRANENYEPTKVVSEEVKNSIPKEVELVFWDYYHENKKFYTDLIVKHRQLGKEPLMASGVWTWRRFWYDKTTTQNTAGPCIDACRETEVKELFFTMWGDDGAYCEYDSALAGLAWCAEKAFSKDGKLNEQKLRKSFDAICGVPYDDIEKAAGLNDICTLSEYMWEDPIFGVEWNERKKENANYWKAALEKCDAVLEDIKPLSDIEQPVDFSHANAIVETIKSRIELGLMVDKLHYADNDSISFALDSCDKVIGNIDNLLLTFRRQWLARNKIEGLELIQTRLAGQKERYCELKRMILHKSHMVSHRVQHHVLALNDCNV